MTRPLSMDIRERAMARLDAGETVRAIAEALSVARLGLVCIAVVSLPGAATMTSNGSAARADHRRSVFTWRPRQPTMGVS